MIGPVYTFPLLLVNLFELSIVNIFKNNIIFENTGDTSVLLGNFLHFLYILIVDTAFPPLPFAVWQ